MARIDQRGLVMHRLAQAILRDQLTLEQAAAARERSEAILVANNPGSPEDPVNWPRWAQLMPHLLAADLAATDSHDLRKMACNACWYLLARGDTRAGYELARNLRQHWHDRLGDDHMHTWAIAHYLGWALRALGRYEQARELDEATVASLRRVLGEDHPDVLRSAGNLATDLVHLGEYQAARELDEDLLARLRGLLGEDHPDTRKSARNLAADRTRGKPEA